MGTLLLKVSQILLHFHFWFHSAPFRTWNGISLTLLEINLSAADTHFPLGTIRRMDNWTWTCFFSVLELRPLTLHEGPSINYVMPERGRGVQPDICRELLWGNFGISWVAPLIVGVFKQPAKALLDKMCCQKKGNFFFFFQVAVLVPLKILTAHIQSREWRHSIYTRFSS